MKILPIVTLLIMALSSPLAFACDTEDSHIGINPAAAEARTNQVLSATGQAAEKEKAAPRSDGKK